MPWERSGVEAAEGGVGSALAAKEKETKVIKTAALKLGALDKTLFAARGSLKRRKKKLQKLAKQFEIIFKATHESRPPSTHPLTTYDSCAI